MRSATPSGQTIRADDWICTSIDAVYKTAAFLVGHVGNQAGVRGVEPCRAALETASSPRRTLLYRPPALRPGAIGVTTTPCSVTFQYASLMNFDQLSIRMLWSAYSGFHVGRTGFFRSVHPRLLRRAVGLPLVAGHAGQHAVLPARHTALRPRYDVVDRQLLAARLGTAVLAGVVVALENVPAAEGHWATGSRS